METQKLLILNPHLHAYGTDIKVAICLLPTSNPYKISSETLYIFLEVLWQHDILESRSISNLINMFESVETVEQEREREYKYVKIIDLLKQCPINAGILMSQTCKQLNLKIQLSNVFANFVFFHTVHEDTSLHSSLVPALISPKWSVLFVNLDNSWPYCCVDGRRKETVCWGLNAKTENIFSGQHCGAASKAVASQIHQPSFNPDIPCCLCGKLFLTIWGDPGVPVSSHIWDMWDNISPSVPGV